MRITLLQTPPGFLGAEQRREVIDLLASVAEGGGGDRYAVTERLVGLLAGELPAGSWTAGRARLIDLAHRAFGARAVPSFSDVTDLLATVAHGPPWPASLEELCSSALATATSGRTYRRQQQLWTALLLDEIDLRLQLLYRCWLLAGGIDPDALCHDHAGKLACLRDGTQPLVSRLLELLGKRPRAAGYDGPCDLCNHLLGDLPAEAVARLNARLSPQSRLYPH